MNTASVRISLTLAALIAVACAPDTPDSPFVSTEVLDTPAGVGSGEPFLASGDDRVFLSWLEEVADGAHELRFAAFTGDGWGEVRTVQRSDRFFVNWADFPSITPTRDGTLWAHWLERGETGGYDYSVRVVHSDDDGGTWSDAWTPHEDGTPTEHGFVSVLSLEDRVGLAWLDGRKYVEGPDGAPATQEMTLRYRTMGTDGEAGPETLVDPRVCDCCQTDAAMTDDGPVIVYRDRTDAEIRDIYVTRRLDDGWSTGVAVHDDGWKIGGCPVNGPAVAARSSRVAVAWFTAPDDIPRVKVAFSSSSGADFDAPVVVDDGNPVGRVDVLLLDEDRALVSWLEQTGEEAGALRLREVRADGTAGPSETVTESSVARASGFPRMARAADGAVLVTWTDVQGERSQVRVSKLELEESPR
ncbi:MAG: hypothetical protein U5R14_07955 [Gemmatimonadota bacterium]|nr:hypothetical protein [Gemmatimonadota bacterium]